MQIKQNKREKVFPAMHNEFESGCLCAPEHDIQ